MAETISEICVADDIRKCNLLIANRVEYWRIENFHLKQEIRQSPNFIYLFDGADSDMIYARDVSKYSVMLVFEKA